MANLLRGKPDTNFAVNTAHSLCPEHLWLMTEGLGTNLVDRGKDGDSDLTLSNASIWATDGGSGAAMLDFEAISGFASIVSALGITDYPFCISVLGKWDQAHNGFFATLGFQGAASYYGARTNSANGRIHMRAFSNEDSQSDVRDFSVTDRSDDTWRWMTTCFQAATSRQSILDENNENSDSTEVGFDSRSDEFHVGQRPQAANLLSGQIAAVMVWEMDIEADRGTIFGAVDSTGLPFIDYDPSVSAGFLSAQGVMVNP